MNHQHVTSLELSQRLKELGVPQRSMFFWTKTKLVKNGWDYELGFNTIKGEKGERNQITNTEIDQDVDACSAYLSSELGEMLPYFVDTKDARGAFDLCIRKAWKTYLISYQKWELEAFSKNKWLKEIVNKNLADALALMLIYLLENNLITLEKGGEV